VVSISSAPIASAPVSSAAIPQQDDGWTNKDAANGGWVRKAA
jgi:hypothetical protein